MALSRNSDVADDEPRKCSRCDGDGWIEHWDSEGLTIVGVSDCPNLDEPWHPPFNASRLLP